MLLVLAIALSFLFPFTSPPSTNFWPLIAAWVCGWVVLMARVLRNLRNRGEAATPSPGHDGNAEFARGEGGLLAALLASVIGLLQYFDAAAGMDPWVHASRPGQAMGNKIGVGFQLTGCWWHI